MGPGKGSRSAFPIPLSLFGDLLAQLRDSPEPYLKNLTTAWTTTALLHSGLRRQAPHLGIAAHRVLWFSFGFAVGHDALAWHNGCRNLLKKQGNSGSPQRGALCVNFPITWEQGLLICFSIPVDNNQKLAGGGNGPSLYATKL